MAKDERVEKAQTALRAAIEEGVRAHRAQDGDNTPFLLADVMVIAITSEFDPKGRPMSDTFTLYAGDTPPRYRVLGMLEDAKTVIEESCDDPDCNCDE